MEMKTAKMSCVFPDACSEISFSIVVWLSIIFTVRSSDPEARSFGKISYLFQNSLLYPDQALDTLGHRLVYPRSPLHLRPSVVFLLEQSLHLLPTTEQGF